MQVCDFCGETDKQPGDLESVRRFELALETESKARYDQCGFWLLDLCHTCLRQFQQTLDNLVMPEIDVNAFKQGGVIDPASLKVKLRQRADSGEIKGI